MMFMKPCSDQILLYEKSMPLRSAKRTVAPKAGANRGVAGAQSSDTLGLNFVLSSCSSFTPNDW
jgi:hypothetical protein